MKKTILITGATSGIGEAMAYNFFKKVIILFYSIKKNKNSKMAEK